MGGIIVKTPQQTSRVKPFYVKYFKSQLKPENKCVMWSPIRQELFDADDVVELPYYEKLPEYDQSYRVDLYVCSRNRELKCPLYYDIQNKEWATLEEVETLYTLSRAMEDENIIPVLGLLSPNQWWLDQGDELDYGDIEPYERWYQRGTTTAWLKMMRIDFNAKDRTNFSREKIGDTMRALAVKNNRSGVYY